MPGITFISTKRMEVLGLELEQCFPGDSEMARRMRAFDWSKSDLGPPETWPQNLRIAVGICLTSRFPIHVWWGPTLTLFYNDAYIPFLGRVKHPAVLGRSGREAWPEIWRQIGPQIDRIFTDGKASWSEDILMFFARELPQEEVYVTFSFSPVFGADNKVDGMFCACTETTEKIVGNRRLETLRRLGVQAAEAQTVAEACRTAADVLGENPHDIPFAAVYLVDQTGENVHLAASAGLSSGGWQPPLSVSLAEGDRLSPWPLASVLQTRYPAESADLGALGMEFPAWPWPEPVNKATVLPIRAAACENLAGLLVAGVSPRRPLDATYRTFLDLVAGHIANAIATARAYEEERKRAEEALRESEEKYRTIVQTANEGIWLVDAEHRTTYVNDRMAEMLGYSPEEMISKTTFDFYGEEGKAISDLNAERRRQGIEGPHEFKLIHKDGTALWTIVNAQPLFDKDGTFTGSLSMFTDITERKQADERVRYQNAILDGINRIFQDALNCDTEEELGQTCLSVVEELTQSEIGFIGELDADGQFCDIALSNPGWDDCQMIDKIGHRKPPAELKLHGIYGKVLLEGKSLFTNDPASHPDRVGLPEGHPPLNSFLGVPLIQDDRTIGTVGLGNRQGGYRQQDAETLSALSPAIVQVFMRKRAEEAMRKTRDYLDNLINYANAPIIVWDPQFCITRFNRAFERLTGYSADEVYGKSLEILFPDDRKEQSMALIHRTMSGERWDAVEIPIAHVDGTVRTVLWNSATLFEADGATAIATIAQGQDITERKRVESALKESEERYRALSEKLREVDLPQSEDRFYKIFHNSPDMITILNNETNEFMEVNQSYLNTIGYEHEEIIGHTPGELGIWSDERLQQSLKECKESGTKINGEYDLHTRSGETVRVLASFLRIRLDNLDCWLIILKDITEKRRYELEMARLDRLNLIGEIAAGIAHEIRNPMTVVRGYLQMMQLNNEFVSHQKRFHTMIEELDRANAIITEFLSLARNKPTELKRQSINGIVTALVPLIQADAAKNQVVVSVDLMDVPDLNMDEKQIRQLILNLVRNGMEATPKHGQLTITTRLKRDRVVLSIKDRGKGILPEVLKKLGTPFFTTKEKGTGLGLPVCYRIAENHNARIEIKTGRRGTTFAVSFEIPSI